MASSLYGGDFQNWRAQQAPQAHFRVVNSKLTLHHRDNRLCRTLSRRGRYGLKARLTQLLACLIGPC
ncbi:hypothetical protein N4R57_17085 [Rhodobacteraceae bacterium D3-12]|nr:hypothetical protein N4R57_17085 [Rhodobacteraceae bacterium D3-12]